MIHAAGLFLINKDGKILICHPTKHADDFWSIPKGRINRGESPLEAAIRETHEECNILLSPFHNCINLGKEKYKHGKKDIVCFIYFEDEYDHWDEIELKCNSSVPEYKGGFLEMDDFKWVNVRQAQKVLHKTQVAFLDKVDKMIAKRSLGALERLKKSGKA